MRTDRQGPHRAAFERNKKRLLKSENVCGICGKPIDMSLKAPDPMSPCIDHIIPVSKGGHPSDIENLQLAHCICNRQKSDKLLKETHLKVMLFQTGTCLGPQTGHNIRGHDSLASGSAGVRPSLYIFSRGRLTIKP